MLKVETKDWLFLTIIVLTHYSTIVPQKYERKRACYGMAMDACHVFV